MRRLLLTSALAVGLGLGVFMAPASVSADVWLDEEVYWDIPVYTWEDYLNDILQQLEPMGPIGP